MINPRVRKVAVWSGAGLLGLVLLLVSAAFIIPNTEGGRAFILRKTAELSKGQVKLVGLHGSFPAALDLDRVELRDAEGLWLWADHLSLRWSPAALLSRHVDVDALHVGLLHVERQPIPDKDAKPSSSSSSVPRTDLKDLRITTLELGKALAGDPTSLTVQGNAHLRSLEDVDAHLAASRTAGNGDYEVEAHMDPKSIKAIVKLQEPANGPLQNLLKAPDLGAIAALVKIEGPRQAENLTLSVDAGPLRARANGRIDLQNSTADLDYSLTAPAMAPYEGLSWESVKLQGQLHGPFTAPKADGHLLIKALQAPGGAQLAQLDAQLQGDKGYVELRAAINGLLIPGQASRLFQSDPVTLQAGAHLDDPQRPVDLTVSHPLLTLNAKAITAGSQSADLNLQIPSLKPFAVFTGGTKLSGDAQMTAHVDYSPANTKLKANLSSHLDGGAAAWAGLVRGGLTQLELAAQLNDQRISVETLKLTGKAVALNAEATVDRTGDQTIQARFDLGLPNLARVSPALAGDLKMTGTAEGPQQQMSVDTRVTTNLSVHGSPRGRVLARLEANGLPKTPKGALEASGQLDGAPLQVNVQVQPVNETSHHVIIRRADWKSLHADGDVTLGNSVADTRGAMKILVGDLNDFSRLAGSALAGSINANTAFVARGNRPSAKLDLEAHNIVAGGITANAKVNADGPMDALKVSVGADSPAVAGQPARIQTTTIVNATAKELQLASLQVSYHDQQLHLLQPAKIQMAEGLKIQQLRLGIQDATIEVDGQVSPTLDLRAAVKQIKPELVNAFVPDALAGGVMDADVSVQGTTASPTGTVNFKALGIRAKSAVTQGLPAADLRASAHLNGDTADVDAHLTAGGNSQLALTGKAPLAAGGNANLKLTGNLDLALANSILEASGRHVTGVVAFDTSVTGTTADPQIAGTVDISKGSIRDYTQGISLTDITGNLNGSHGVLAIQKLTAKAAPGTISITGTIGVMEPKIPVSLELIAKDAQPVASNIVTANLDANMQVNGTAREQLDVTGKIHLNRADISVPGGMPPEVAVLDVEREGTRADAAAAKPLVINLHLDVAAPNRILITGRGLDAEMGGDLRIRGTTAAPVIEGGFELQRGFFNLANSKLKFTAGTVTFNGTGLQKSLDPSLDFTAQTKAAEVMAVVHITGLADAPQIELTSTPDLPQDEILARLLFGEPAAQLTALQLVETGAALASLRGGGGGSSLNPVAKIQKALGLDRLSVGGGSSASGSSSSSGSGSSGTTVEAGRYVSSRVYVGVKESTGGQSTVDVDVDLTKRLKLQAQLGNGTPPTQGVTPENDPGSRLGLAYQFEY